MKTKFWLCKRGSAYYLFDAETGHRTSLRTSDQNEAKRILQAKNEISGRPALGMALARPYLSGLDPALVQRTWHHVFDDFCARGQPQTQAFRKRKLRHPAFDLIHEKKLVEPAAEDFRAVLESSGVMVQAILRCVHNLALGLGWLPWPVPPKLWPVQHFKPKRGITQDEQRRIVAAEQNRERRSYYEILWEIGASQTDAVLLKAENIDWQSRTIAYLRNKTGTLACITIGPRLETILRTVPVSGPLFPNLSATTEGARSAEFWRRCRLLEIKRVRRQNKHSLNPRSRRTDYQPPRYRREVSA